MLIFHNIKNGILSISTTTAFYIFDILDTSHISENHLGNGCYSSEALICSEDRLGGMRIVEVCRSLLPYAALVSSGDTPGKVMCYCIIYVICPFI